MVKIGIIVVVVGVGESEKRNEIQKQLQGRVLHGSRWTSEVSPTRQTNWRSCNANAKMYRLDISVSIRALPLSPLPTQHNTKPSANLYLSTLYPKPRFLLQCFLSLFSNQFLAPKSNF